MTGSCWNPTPVKDFLVAATYRKDALVGELWQEEQADASGGYAAEAAIPLTHAEYQVIDLPAAFEQLDISLTAIAKGQKGERRSAARAFATMLAYANAPLRWEPLNSTSQHRAAPSPRGLFTTRLHVIHICRGQMITLRYDPYNHVLVKVFSSDAAEETEDSLKIMISADLERCLVPYGDFALCLAPTEAGGVAVQLLAVARALNLDITPYVAGGDSALESSIGAEHAGSMILAAIDIHEPELIELPDLFQERTGIFAVVQPSDSRLGDFPALAKLKTMAAGSIVARETDRRFDGCEVDSNNPTTDVLRVIEHRSSGLDGRGGGRSSINANALTFAQSVVVGRKLSDLWLGLRHIDFELDVVLADEPNEGIEAARELLGPFARMVSGKQTDGSAFTSQASDGCRFEITLSVDHLAACQKFGNLAITLLHFACGVEMQALSLAIAEAGFFCRPLRAFRHDLVEQGLPLESTAILQMVGGIEHEANPGYMVSPL